jgi:hypothetical protein
MNAKEWSARYAAHLKTHRPKTYRGFQEDGDLEAHLESVGKSAEEMEQEMERQYLAMNKPPTEDYAAKVAHLGTARQVAEEIVNTNLILVPAEEDDRAMKRGYYAD